MKRALLLAQLLALVVAGEVLAQPGGALPPNGGCIAGGTCKASFFKATAPQGTASAKCFFEGGTGNGGVCLGGYPAALSQALYIGITPSARGTTNYALRTVTGSTLDVNAPGSVLNLQLGGSSKWNVQGVGHLTALSNGNRLDLGNGASDHLTSDGTNVIAAGPFNANGVIRAQATLEVNGTSANGIYNATSGYPLNLFDAQGTTLGNVATASLPTCGASSNGTTVGPGTVLYDSTTNSPKICDGTAWQDIFISSTSDGAEVSYNADHASDPANSCNNWTVSGLTGLTMGSFCQVSSDQVLPNGSQLSCQVISATQVRFERCCNGTAACDLAPANYYARITKR